MLEKDKNCIEFSMRSMMATHKPYQEDTEIAITGMAPGKSLLSANNPFDIPCDVVVVSKRDFDKMQERTFSKAVLADQWEANYNLLLKKTGFDTAEDLVNYLDSEAQCDTLREAIASLEYSVKFARDERRDLSKKLEECEKDYISARDKVEALDKEIGVYSRALKDWKEGTGCPSPSAAKTMIESQASWCHAYHEVKENNQKLAIEVEKWQKATGCETPEGAELNIRRLRGRIDEMKEFAAIASNWTDRIVED